jgi:hypothetical protein
MGFSRTRNTFSTVMSKNKAMSMIRLAKLEGAENSQTIMRTNSARVT